MIPVVALVLTVGKPAWVYVLAKLKHKDLGIVLGKNGRMKILPTDYKSLEIAKTMAWLPKSPKYWNWGGVQTYIVYDGWGVLLDPEMLQAVRDLKEQYGIESYEQLIERLQLTEQFKVELNKLKEKETLTEEEIEKIEQLEGWLETYGIDRTNPVVVKALSVVRVDDIEHYFTDMYPSEIRAHIDENIAEIAQQYVNPITKIGAYVVFGLMILIGGGIALYLIKGALGG
jgi:hypothetical protein